MLGAVKWCVSLYNHGRRDICWGISTVYVLMCHGADVSVAPPCTAPEGPAGGAAQQRARGRNRAPSFQLNLARDLFFLSLVQLFFPPLKLLLWRQEKGSSGGLAG